MVEENTQNKVMSFKETQLRKQASEFVDAYEKEGMVGAIKFSRTHIGRENYAALRKYVQKEFTSRGYEVTLSRTGYDS